MQRAGSGRPRRCTPPTRVPCRPNSTSNRSNAEALVLELEARAADGERDLDNNIARLQIKVVENRAQVLYVEGYPRYDYRYLKNTLIRDPSIALSTLLLSADEQFAQEGDVPIRRFPATAEELRDYDVVLLGDVDPRGPWITAAQLDLLVEFVARDGGGLGLLAGTVYMPGALRDTPLAALLPVDPAEDDGLTTAFLPRPTVAGTTSPVLRLLVGDDATAALFDRLPEWYWTSPLAGVRPGTEVVDLTVTDTDGLVAMCSATVTVEDQEPPTITAPGDVQEECTSPDGTPVDLGMPTGIGDNCDANPTITNDAPAVFPLGTTIVTWTATDDAGNSTTDTQEVTIVDTTPPELSVSVSPDRLWPPNHKYVTISATVVATDICDADPEVRLVSVTSNEPDNGRGDGNTVNDIVIVDDFTVELRAERSGRGTGRIYTFTYEAEDDSGNVTVEQATVTVPKSRRR